MQNLTLIAIVSPFAEHGIKAQQLSEQFSLPIVSQPPDSMEPGNFVLFIDSKGLSLQETGKKAPGPIRVDFLGGSNAHRRQFGGGKGQMIAKAVGIKGSYRPYILDATAGLGQDAFVLLGLGCSMSLIERSKVVYALLEDGIARACQQSNELKQLFNEVELHHQSALGYLESLNDVVDVIYLDPMFPARTGKAEVNKSMKAFHTIVGEDNDAGLLLQKALEKAHYRVVVKRSRKAPCLSEQYPELELPKASLVFEGKSTRFDVYPLKKMPH